RFRMQSFATRKTFWQMKSSRLTRKKVSSCIPLSSHKGYLRPWKILVLRLDGRLVIRFLTCCPSASCSNNVVNGTPTTLRSVAAHYHRRYGLPRTEDRKQWIESL